MCEIINFPQDHKDRVEKIKHIMERKNKQTVYKNQPLPQQPTPKQHTVINTVTHLQITGIEDLNKTLADTNDTLKYITDCIYDLTRAIYKLKVMVLILSIFLIGSVSAVFLFKLI